MDFIWFPEGIPIRKRLFDLILAILSLLITLPIIVLVALVIRIIDGRPVIFRQDRPGYCGQIIRIIKFRTMKDFRDPGGNLLLDEHRLTALGKFLRSTSLDELPELVNVVVGQMSMVGPRPLLVDYLPLYSPEQARRHDVLPGITGWAQINGRNTLSWEEKFRLDTWYVDHWSLRLDVKILLLTFWKVLIREGITQPGLATSEPFKGSPAPSDPADETT
jgi:sugar transferase EpsL